MLTPAWISTYLTTNNYSIRDIFRFFLITHVFWKGRWRTFNYMYNTHTHTPRWTISQTITGFLESGFKLTVKTGGSIGSSIFRYKETSLWESDPLPILVLLLNRFVVALFFDSLLLVDAITSGDSWLFTTIGDTDSLSLSLVWVEREVRAASAIFRSFNSIS